MPANTQSPSSYFFTDTAFNQATNDKFFAPLDENRFRITTTFAGNLNAYAVTDGILLIAIQKGSNNNKINILLKPSKDIGLGVKIKYFVYRGIDATGLFKTTEETILVDNGNPQNCVAEAWDAFVEFNQTTEIDLQASQIGLIEDSAELTKDTIKRYFSNKHEDGKEYNLLKVKAGTKLGKFVDGSAGFEIVLDDGDYLQENSDTGLDFDLSFVTASAVVLNTNQDPNNLNQPNEFGAASNPNIDPKIFRENIYKFLDPAAFYGSHVADNNNGGIRIIGGTTDVYSSEADIYTNIVSRFSNKDKVYIYIKSTRGRSFNFYNEDKKLYLNGTAVSFSYSNWPLFYINAFYKTYTMFFGPTGMVASNRILTIKHTNIDQTETDTPGDLLSIPKYDRFEVSFSFSGDFTRMSQFLYLNFLDNTELPINNLFGNINLETIFEKEDFSGNQISYVTHLRPVLIKEGEDIGLYQTKLILDGNISNTDLAPSDSDLRTYILFPQATTSETLVPKKDNLTAGYYSAANNPEDYCRNIYGEGEIWRGIINDNGTDVKSLLYRRKDNDEAMPIYQLGISQLDYQTLIDAVENNATNLFFIFENQTTGTNASFLKYDLKIQFDKQDGTIGKTTQSIAVYTIDDCFFFTEKYSAGFKYYKEFAETTVEFRPHQDWDGEFGIDWYRKGQNTWLNDPFGFKIYDMNFAGNVGTMPAQMNGNDYEDVFEPDNKMLAKLKREEYNVKITPWSLGDNETECFTSWLSLDKDQTAKLNLRIRVKKEAGKLSIRYPNQYFKINDAAGYLDAADALFSFYDLPADQKTVTAAARFFDLKITCIKEFAFAQILQVKADDRLAGMLKAFPNANKPVQNILFVPVKIKLPDNKERNFSPGSESPVSSDYISNQKKWLAQFLLHSQIKANIEMFNNSDEPLAGDNYGQLDLTSDTNFTEEFTPDDSDPANNKGMFIRKTVNNQDITVYSLRAYYKSQQTNRLDLKQYLTDHLPEKYKADKYKSYLIAFFMNVAGFSMTDDTTQKDQLNGYSGGKWTNLLIFKLSANNNETVSHETYHSLDMPHTFDKLSENSLYVYKPQQTDNLLDYTHDRRSLFHWQWLIARKNIKK